MGLKEMRKSLGLTQEAFANDLDVSQATVSYWERGTVTPTKKARRRLMELLDLTEEELMQALGGDEKC